MAHIVRQEPMSSDDRAAIDEQVSRILATGASPLVPLCIGALGVLVAAGGFQQVNTSSVVPLAMVIAGSVLAVGGLWLAAGRRQYQRVMQAYASRLNRNASDADGACVYEIIAQAGHIVGGDSNAVDEEWSGAVIRTPAGAILFVEVEVALQFPRDVEYVQRVPCQFIIRALPTHELIRVIIADDAAAAEFPVTEEELERLAAWVFAAEADDAPCREIPPGIIG